MRSLIDEFKKLHKAERVKKLKGYYMINKKGQIYCIDFIKNYKDDVKEEKEPSSPVPVFGNKAHMTTKLNFRVLQSSSIDLVKSNEARSLPVEDGTRGTNTADQEEMKVEAYETKIAPSSVPSASAE